MCQQQHCRQLMPSSAEHDTTASPVEMSEDTDPSSQVSSEDDHGSSGGSRKLVANSPALCSQEQDEGSQGQPSAKLQRGATGKDKSSAGTSLPHHTTKTISRLPLHPLSSQQPSISEPSVGRKRSVPPKTKRAGRGSNENVHPGSKLYHSSRKPGPGEALLSQAPSTTSGHTRLLSRAGSSTGGASLRPFSLPAPLPRSGGKPSGGIQLPMAVSSLDKLKKPFKVTAANALEVMSSCGPASATVSSSQLNLLPPG